MSQVYTYFSPTTPGNPSWSVDLGDTVVRLGTVDGFVDEAELGSVGVSNLVLEDTTGTLGHAGDDIVGLKQFFVDELDCPSGDQRVWTGYIGRRKYRRGTPPRTSLRIGQNREIDMELADLNSFLSFRRIKPTTVDPTSDFNRPAETDVVRVAALLSTVDFLSTTLFDLGLVASTGGVAMNACDYANQTPADVLNDCAQQSGRNFFVYYDESANKLGLFYHFDYDAVYDSSLKLTNVLSEVDSDSTHPFGTTTFAIEPDGYLEKDPSRIISAVELPYSGGTVYQDENDTGVHTSYTFAWRDGSAPSVNVKDATKATARADRYLIDNSTEAERIHCSVKLPSSVVTGIKPGQRVQCHFTSMPGMEAGFRWCRVVYRMVGAREETDQLYQVSLELVPLPTPMEIVQFAIDSGHGASRGLVFPNPVAEGNSVIYFVCVAGTPGTSPPSPINTDTSYTFRANVDNIDNSTEGHGGWEPMNIAVYSAAVNHTWANDASMTGATVNNAPFNKTAAVYEPPGAYDTGTMAVEISGVNLASAVWGASGPHLTSNAPGAWSASGTASGDSMLLACVLYTLLSYGGPANGLSGSGTVIDAGDGNDTGDADSRQGHWLGYVTGSGSLSITGTIGQGAFFPNAVGQLAYGVFQIVLSP